VGGGGVVLRVYRYIIGQGWRGGPPKHKEALHVPKRHRPKDPCQVHSALRKPTVKQSDTMQERTARADLELPSKFNKRHDMDNPRHATLQMQRYAKDKARVAAGSPDRQMDGLLEEGPEPGSADGDLPVAETRPLLAAPAEDGVGGLQTPDEEQKALDDRFAEARQIPPVRFSIMVLLTAGAPHPPRPLPWK